MATSQRKIEANRANALKSTGPRTPRGKRAASRNALAHGLTSRAALLPGDDPREYRRFVLAVLDELDPRGPLQEELAGEIANLSWKLRRAPGAEAILLAQKHRAGQEEPTEVIVNMIQDKTWQGDPCSPLWMLDRYTHNIVRTRATALRMLLALKKQARAGGQTREESPDGAKSRVQNEATGPAGGDAAQARRPQPDAAGAAPPEAPKDAQGGANGELS